MAARVGDSSEEWAVLELVLTLGTLQCVFSGPRCQRGLFLVWPVQVLPVSKPQDHDESSTRPPGSRQTTTPVAPVRRPADTMPRSQRRR